MRHRGKRRSSANPRASKPPKFRPSTTTPRVLEKKRDGFQTLPNDASPPPISTTFLMPTERAPPSPNSPWSSASTEPPSPATSTATASLATVNRPLAAPSRSALRSPRTSASATSRSAPSRFLLGVELGSRLGRNGHDRQAVRAVALTGSRRVRSSARVNSSTRASTAAARAVGWRCCTARLTSSLGSASRS